MSTTKDIVCLANSWKTGGSCVAGRQVLDGAPGPWIRPVSARETQEISASEQRLDIGRKPRVLDLIRVPLEGPAPSTHQQENWQIVAGAGWEHLGTFPAAELDPFAEQTGRLWLDGDSSTNGMNDRMSDLFASTFDSSLRLVLVGDLRLRVDLTPTPSGERKRFQARFTHAGVEHHMRLTDPSYRTLLDEYEVDDEHHIGEAFVTVSLTEPRYGYCYMLVAAVVEG